jgi:hypothetical protein
MGGDSPVFPSLEYLDLSETDISGDINVLGDKGVVFPQLKYLNLSGTGITGGFRGSIKDIFPMIPTLLPKGLIFDDDPDKFILPDYCLAQSSTQSPQ